MRTRLLNGEDVRMGSVQTDVKFASLECYDGGLEYNF